MPEVPGGDSDDLFEELRLENEWLRQRVEQMDAAASEYRRQMTAMLTSMSWRVTSPIRISAGRARVLKRRIRSLPRRLRGRDTVSSFSSVGLFAPAAPRPGSLATVDSPLLARPHLATRSDVEQPPADRRARILVVAHVYYPEVWPDIEDRLARLPERYDLVVTLVRGRAESLEREILRRFPEARIHIRDNYGRDLASILELADLRIFEGYDAVLKVHTKRSPHRLDGDGWRVALLDGVLPSPEGVQRILELLRTDRGVGMVVPGGSLKGAETWGSDRELVEALAARIPLAFDPDQLEYSAGSMYWIKPWVLQRLSDLRLDREHFESEANHLDGSTAHALERFIGIVAKQSGLEMVETDDVPSRLHRARRRARLRPRVLAFYLPQFHRIPENDAWWGDGFTDWRNVEAAESLYAGHVQPIEPADLGCYDLSDPEAMRAQGALAAAYGVDGFVVHHYWFDGTPLLEAPLRNLLADPSIDFPFALCWANESWTRRWDGLETDVLIKQSYPAGWEDRFYDDLAPALRDPRYITVDGNPLLVIYRPGEIRKGAEAIKRLRQRAKRDGFGDLHVLGVLPARELPPVSADVAGELDGWVHFPPGSGLGLHSVRSLLPEGSDGLTGDVYAFDAAVDGADLSTVGPHGMPQHPGVMPGWDNTARRRSAAYVFHGGNPVSFRRWLSRAVQAAGPAGRMVFVNAWNEWAEGAHLEPDVRFGRGNLEAVLDVVGNRRAADATAAPTSQVASLDVWVQEETLSDADATRSVAR
jgi:lipopolysaccharide biosynthesis protein